jgi:hypothetical protein
VDLNAHSLDLAGYYICCVGVERVREGVGFLVDDAKCNILFKKKTVSPYFR